VIVMMKTMLAGPGGLALDAYQALSIQGVGAFAAVAALAAVQRAHEKMNRRL
jgi:hypothetical protein